MTFHVLFRTASAPIISEKVILSINDDHSQGENDFERGFYKCQPDQVYVIVGKYFHTRSMLIYIT